MVQMLVTHFAITVLHQILALVTGMMCRDFSAFGRLVAMADNVMFKLKLFEARNKQRGNYDVIL